jgi:hypothetical protein
MAPVIHIHIMCRRNAHVSNMHPATRMSPVMLMLIRKFYTDGLLRSLHLNFSIKSIDGGLRHGSICVSDKGTAILGCVVAFLLDDVDTRNVSVGRE